MNKHYLIIFNKYFIVFLCSVFSVFPSLLFVEDQVPWEVGSEKAVVYRRGMGEGKETGLYR